MCLIFLALIDFFKKVSNCKLMWGFYFAESKLIVSQKVDLLLHVLVYYCSICLNIFLINSLYPFVNYITLNLFYDFHFCHIRLNSLHMTYLIKNRTHII